MGQTKESTNVRSLICELHKCDKTEPISKLPGLWKRRLDERWTLWVNGHMTVQKIVDSEHGCQGAEVRPGDVCVEFNGWPAGMFSLINGDGVLAAGEAANYGTFCEALRTAIAHSARARDGKGGA